MTAMARRGTSMERIITLLKEKNHYLEKFRDLNEKELRRFEAGNFENIEGFYETRDNILDLIKLIDEMIDEENENDSIAPHCSSEHRQVAEYLLKRKEDLVAKILAQDLEVISWIEKEKSNIIRELQTVQKGRRAMSGYRSGAATRQLDEEV